MLCTFEIPVSYLTSIIYTLFHSHTVRYRYDILVGMSESVYVRVMYKKQENKIEKDSKMEEIKTTKDSKGTLIEIELW